LVCRPANRFQERDAPVSSPAQTKNLRRLLRQLVTLVLNCRIAARGRPKWTNFLAGR
jgi:hypothetical protein